MRLQPPRSRLELLRANGFSPKRILLVDDDLRYRASLKEAAMRAGHEILFETDNLDNALRMLPTVLDLLEVAVLDSEILDTSGTGIRRKIDGGWQIAQAITEANPGIGIVSVSESWKGRWLNPKFDPGNPHLYNSSYDVNGWQETRVPDFSVQQVGFNVGNLADLIGRYVPQRRDEYILAYLDYSQKVSKERSW